MTTEGLVGRSREVVITSPNDAMSMQLGRGSRKTTQLFPSFGGLPDVGDGAQFGRLELNRTDGAQRI